MFVLNNKKKQNKQRPLLTAYFQFQDKKKGFCGRPNVYFDLHSAYHFAEVGKHTHSILFKQTCLNEL